MPTAPTLTSSTELPARVLMDDIYYERQPEGHYLNPLLGTDVKSISQVRDYLSPEATQARHARWDLYHQARYAEMDIISFANPDSPELLNPRA